MGPELEPEDVAAMRREDPDGWRRYLRQQVTNGRQRSEVVPKPAPSPPPGHQPGAWPRGTSPPGPPRERQIPTHVWDAAVRHYRNTVHHPDRPCDCGNCPQENR